MNRLMGRSAVVTGGARGIGAAIARAYVAEGASVAILDRDGARAAATAEAIGDGCRSFEVDVADEAAVEAAFEAIAASGPIDILVNDAAVQREGALVDQTLADARLVIDTNLVGTFLCSRAALRSMLRNRSGVILNLSSVLGLTGDALLPIYSATKHAILGLTRSTAAAYAEQGIRCLAICPGDVDTELNDQYFASQPDPAAFRARVEREYPMRRMARPEEIARLAVALATDDASFMNGTYVLADGGIMARLFDLY
ncbi:MAG TPA: SDR family oxidoreductase [Candidatus Limnocylindrales bacterium]|jgi:meso-butanediol dehydrogenase / (S,S)-butanediol dehydrogenase / diacetyl reductase